MELHYDQDADALDVRLVPGAVAELTRQIDSGTLVDLDELGGVIAIEVIHPARTWPLEEIIASFALNADDVAMLRDLVRRGFSFSGSGRVGVSAQPQRVEPVPA